MITEELAISALTGSYVKPLHHRARDPSVFTLFLCADTLIHF